MLVGIIMQLSGFVSGQKIQLKGQPYHSADLSVGTLVVLACGFLRFTALQTPTLHTHSLRSETSNARKRSRSAELTSAEHPRGVDAGGDAHTTACGGITILAI